MSNYGRSGQTGGGGVRPRGVAQSNAGARPQPATENRLSTDDSFSRRWANYLQGGYFDERGDLKIEYVARCLPGQEALPDDQMQGVERFVLAMANGYPKLTHGQLRRFFQHCRAVETRLRSGTTDWPKLRRYIQFLDAAAADAYGKQPAKIPEIFYEFIRRNVAAIKNEKDFREGFLPHFEALVGFAALHLPRDRS